jgi:hypothetical protein
MSSNILSIIEQIAVTIDATAGIGQLGDEYVVVNKRAALQPISTSGHGRIPSGYVLLGPMTAHFQSYERADAVRRLMMKICDDRAVRVELVVMAAPEWAAQRIERLREMIEILEQQI